MIVIIGGGANINEDEMHCSIDGAKERIQYRTEEGRPKCRAPCIKGCNEAPSSIQMLSK